LANQKTADQLLGGQPIFLGRKDPNQVRFKDWPNDEFPRWVIAICKDRGQDTKKEAIPQAHWGSAKDIRTRSLRYIYENNEALRLDSCRQASSTSDRQYIIWSVASGY
jgi:hypothetical protein